MPLGHSALDQEAFRADDGTRTRDPHLGKVMRYQLRYVRVRCASHPSRRPWPASNGLRPGGSDQLASLESRFSRAESRSCCAYSMPGGTSSNVSSRNAASLAVLVTNRACPEGEVSSSSTQVGLERLGRTRTSPSPASPSRPSASRSRPNTHSTGFSL